MIEENKKIDEYDADKILVPKIYLFLQKNSLLFSDNQRRKTMVLCPKISRGSGKQFCAIPKYAARGEKLAEPFFCGVNHMVCYPQKCNFSQSGLRDEAPRSLFFGFSFFPQKKELLSCHPQLDLRSQATHCTFLYIIFFR